MKFKLIGNFPIEVFPFVTSLHREVIIRQVDGYSEDIELTPDEAETVGRWLIVAADEARRKVPL